MKSLSVLAVLVSVVLADDNATSTSTTTLAPTLEATTLESVQKEKIARRIIDERLSPPRASEFGSWSGKKLSLGEVHRISGPRVTEVIEDDVTDKPITKKSRNVGPSQEPIGGFAAENKEKSSNNSEAAGGSGGNGTGPAPRFHGNRPSDDRYGWRSSSYLGYGKDKGGGFYDHRNHYPYDRYSPHRPSSNYALDGDRYRPGTQGFDGDRFGSSSSSSSSGGGSNRPASANYVNANYGFGPYDRPRPGGNYGAPGGGISGSIGGDPGDPDYTFGENGAGPGGNAVTNLQTQKAVALKALAGVALIGAAAALASNPVLLPVSLLTGKRKRRSTDTSTTTATPTEEFSDNLALTALLEGYIQPRPNEVPHEELASIKKIDSNSSDELRNINVEPSTSEELVISPQCVARLACHVHRDYLDELDKSRAQLRAAASDDPAESEALNGLERWFNSLIHTNILVADYLSEELKALIQSAVALGSNRNASCDEFSCLNVQDSANKTKSDLKN